MVGSPWIAAKSLKHSSLETLVTEMRQGIAGILGGASRAENVCAELKARGLPVVPRLFTPELVSSLKETDAAFLKLARTMRSNG